MLYNYPTLEKRTERYNYESKITLTFSGCKLLTTTVNILLWRVVLTV